MKYGAHQNYCNGPGDCSCGQDYREFADRAVEREIEESKRVDKLYSSSISLRKEAAELIKAAKVLERESKDANL